MFACLGGEHSISFLVVAATATAESFQAYDEFVSMGDIGNVDAYPVAGDVSAVFHLETEWCVLTGRPN